MLTSTEACRAEFEQKMITEGNDIETLKNNLYKILL